MAGPRIGTAPRGLLGALEAKIGGENPRDLGMTVVPTIDLYDQYLIERTGIATESAAIAIGTAVTTVTLLPGATGVLWRLLGVGAIATVAAADDDHMTMLEVFLVNPTGTTICPMMPALLTNTPGIGTPNLLTRSNGVMLPVPFWLPPGFYLQARVTVDPVPSAAGTLSLRSIYQRIVE